MSLDPSLKIGNVKSMGSRVCPPRIESWLYPDLSGITVTDLSLQSCSSGSCEMRMAITPTHLVGSLSGREETVHRLLAQGLHRALRSA